MSLNSLPIRIKSWLREERINEELFNGLSPDQQHAIIEALEALRDRCPNGRTRGFHLLDGFGKAVDLRMSNPGLSTMLLQVVAQVLLDDPECVSLNDAKIGWQDGNADAPELGNLNCPLDAIE